MNEKNKLCPNPSDVNAAKGRIGEGVKGRRSHVEISDLARCAAVGDGKSDATALIFVWDEMINYSALLQWWRQLTGGNDLTITHRVIVRITTSVATVTPEMSEVKHKG